METPIGVALTDPEAFHDLVKGLKALDVPLIILEPQDEAPSHVPVVVVDAATDPAPLRPRDLPFTTLDETLHEALERRLRAQDAETLFLGVDPGPMPGLALIARGDVVWNERLDRIKDVRGHVRRLVRTYGRDKVLVRVGDGGGRHLRLILPHLRGARIEIVDESRTTPSVARAHRDVLAAEAIALTPGRSVEVEDRVRRVTRGEVREVQDHSRIRSGGRVTLSYDVAKRVARGELTMDEALAGVDGLAA